MVALPSSAAVAPPTHATVAFASAEESNGANVAVDTAARDTATSVGYESMDAFFNRRDVAAIEGMFEEKAAAAPEQHVFDMPSDIFQDFESQVLEEQFQTSASTWQEFEGEEGDGEFENENEEGEVSTARSSAALQVETDERVKRAIAAKEAHGLPKRRRLDGKQAPQQTNYTEGALVEKNELKRLRSIKAEALKKRSKTERVVVAQAVAAVIAQPEILHGTGFEAGAQVLEHQAPHV